MQPRIKMGLAVGAIGLALNVCVSGFIGICGLLISLLAGGVAGFLAAQQEKLPKKSEGAKAGAIAGGIAGALVIIGQIIGGIGALALMQTVGMRLPFGTIPSAGDTTATIVYYVAGAGTGFCIGLVGALLAAGVGAGVGYAATNEQPPAISPM